MIVGGQIVGGEIVGGALVGGHVVGDDEGGAVTTTITLAGAGWDVTQRAALDGALGCTRKGAYLVSATEYIWCSHDDGTGTQVGYDPADFVAALIGKTGTEVELGPGALTGAQVATAVRSATGATGTGADVILEGSWSVGPVAFDSRGTAAMYGDRRATANSAGNPIDVALAQHFTAPAGPVLVDAIGVYLSTPDVDEDIRVAIYTGGTAGSQTGTALAVQGVITPTAVAGWHWLHLTAAQALELAGESCRIAIKAEATATHPGLWPTGTTDGSDLTDQAIEIYDGTIDPDPTVAWPASLAGLLSGTASVTMMVAITYRTAPFVSDGSWEGTLGVHSDAVISGGLESDLQGPQAPGSVGANVQMAMRSPNIAGMVVASPPGAVTIGTEHASQFRGGLRSGGSIGNPTGSTRIADLGATSGSATNAWVNFGASGGESVAADTLLHFGIRSITTTVSVRYAASGSGIVDPPGFPTDFAGGSASEYESGRSNASYSCDQTVAIEASFTADAGDIQPGNYPGLRLHLRVDGDTVA